MEKVRVLASPSLFPIINGPDDPAASWEIPFSTKLPTFFYHILLFISKCCYTYVISSLIFTLYYVNVSLSLGMCGCLHIEVIGGLVGVSFLL